MSTFILFLVVLAAAFAIAVALRTHADVEDAMSKVRRLSQQMDMLGRDLSTLEKRLGGPVPESVPPSTNGRDASSAPEADPRVYVQLVPDQPHDRVILSNRSSVPAQNLTLHLAFPDGASPFLPEFTGASFPVPELRQGVPYIVLASFRNGHGPPLDARLEWRDPGGRIRVREFPLRW